MLVFLLPSFFFHIHFKNFPFALDQEDTDLEQQHIFVQIEHCQELMDFAESTGVCVCVCVKAVREGCQN